MKFDPYMDPEEAKLPTLKEGNYASVPAGATFFVYFKPDPYAGPDDLPAGWAECTKVSEDVNYEIARDPRTGQEVRRTPITVHSGTKVRFLGF